MSSREREREVLEWDDEDSDDEEDVNFLVSVGGCE